MEMFKSSKIKIKYKTRKYKLFKKNFLLQLKMKKKINKLKLANNK